MSDFQKATGLSNRHLSGLDVQNLAHHNGLLHYLSGLLVTAPESRTFSVLLCRIQFNPYYTMVLRKFNRNSNPISIFQSIPGFISNQWIGLRLKFYRINHGFLPSFLPSKSQRVSGAKLSHQTYDPRRQDRWRFLGQDQVVRLPVSVDHTGPEYQTTRDLIDIASKNQSPIGK